MNPEKIANFFPFLAFDWMNWNNFFNLFFQIGKLKKKKEKNVNIKKINEIKPSQLRSSKLFIKYIKDIGVLSKLCTSFKWMEISSSNKKWKKKLRNTKCIYLRGSLNFSLLYILGIIKRWQKSYYSYHFYVIILIRQSFCCKASSVWKQNGN